VPSAVVVLLPVADHHACLRDRPEHVDVQALVPDAAVERLDVSVSAAARSSSAPRRAQTPLDLGRITPGAAASLATDVDEGFVLPRTQNCREGPPRSERRSVATSPPTSQNRQMSSASGALEELAAPMLSAPPAAARARGRDRSPSRRAADAWAGCDTRLRPLTAGQHRRDRLHRARHSARRAAASPLQTKTGEVFMSRHGSAGRQTDRCWRGPDARGDWQSMPVSTMSTSARSRRGAATAKASHATVCACV
jgi:hypothetical protein